ncbi:MAG: molybdopterin molybdotransferase MoeA, partial [Candidatus Hadarchaeales archaeon]
LNHQRLGVLVAAGVRRVRVFLPPRVGVLSTGNELVEAGGRLAPGKVHDVNGPMLCAALKEIGCRPLWLGIAPDELKVLRGKIERGLRECDLLLITGGTSAGTGDLLPSILPALFHGLAIKPGKPTLFALVRGKPVFGLPGNPLSAFFVFRELVAPYLLKLRGARMKEEMVHAKLSVDLSSERGREEFVLVKLRGEKELEAVPLRQGSDAINLLGLADGYISIPVEIERLRAGETVRVKLLAR